MIIDTGNETYPQALITGVNFEDGRVDFRWVGDNQDRSAFHPVDHLNLIADITAAIQSVFGGGS